MRMPKPRLLDFGAIITPPLGGPAQRLNRLGSRFAIDVQAATSSSVEAGRILVARLMTGMTQGVLLRFPQDLKPCTSPDPVVDGAGQAGMTLNLRGWQAQAWAKEGQFFSLVHAGRRYVHFITAQAIAGADGTMAAAIYPPMRVTPADGDVCEFGEPMIEGFLSGNQLEWQLQNSAHVDVSFTVTEAE